MHVVENAKRGSIIDSAYGYKDAVYNGLLEKLSNDPLYELPTGNFSLVSENTLNSDENVINVNVSGTTPNIGSWLELRHGEVVAFSLKFDDYVVTKYENENFKITKGINIADNPAIKDRNNAINKARELINNIDINEKNNAIIEIENGWLAIANNEIISYSVKVEENNKKYIVTFEDKSLNETTDSTYTAIIGTTLSSTDKAESYIVKAQVSNYLNLLLSSSTITEYTEDKILTALDITSATGITIPSEMDDNSWIRFAYDDTKIPEITISNYSIKLGDYIVDYSSSEIDNMIVNKGGTLRNKPVILTSLNIGDAISNFGGYDWHVIGTTNTTITLLMDAGENGNYKLPSNTNLQKDDINKVSKMPNCTWDSTTHETNCTPVVQSGNSYYITYSWDKSLIKDYLNGTFLSTLESQIGNEIIPVTVCNDPARGDGGQTYGGYLKSEIESKKGATCNIGKNNNYSDYKVRLITYNEYDTIMKNSSINDKNIWFYSSSIDWWWSMASSSYHSLINMTCAHGIHLAGEWYDYHGNSNGVVRAVITVSK